MTRISELAADSTFDQHAKGSKRPSQQHKMEDPSTNSPNGDSRDSRHAYTKQLQAAAKSAIQNLQNDSLLANSTWVAPLSAAPGAISVMAFLLTASSNPKVAGMKVGSQSVMNKTNTKEIGKLPSPYIHTNLLHCSDLGRIAFLDAQQRMLKINTSARSMMKEGGKISYMIELLEDPVDASRNLMRAIGAVKAEATDCGKQLAETKEKFEYWHRVIFKLSEEAADSKNKTEQEQNQIDDITRAKKDEQSKFEFAEAAAIADISDLKDQLDAAKEQTRRVQNELDALLSLPPVREPSYFEQRRQAQDLAPSKPIEKQNIGAIKKSFAWLVGDTKSMKMEKEAHIAAQEEKNSERVKELLDEARAHREREKQEAQAKVNEARARESELYKEHDRLKEQLAKSREKLTTTSFDLAKAKSDLAKIGHREMELTEIIDILRESSKQLGMLKTRLENLLEFFSALETELTDEALKNVEGFLGAIKDNSTVTGDRVENLDLRKATKKKVLGSALQIQGRFSAIADISEAYVVISQQCIRPMINEMEQLALTKDGEPWQTKCDEFSGKCEQAAAEILRLFTGTREKLNPNMKDRIAMIQRVAIEAAEDNDDSDE